MNAYPVNEIFCSLQGEGYWTGTAATFVRFSGCNLACPFCDTPHAQSRSMETAAAIVRAVGRHPARHVVLTGGEPALFLTAELLDGLHRAGKFVAIETNGTRPLPSGIDWVTLSPKEHCLGRMARPVLASCHELKVVHAPGPFHLYPEITARHRFVQPCDSGEPRKNQTALAECIDFCKSHPEWRLSLQTHKLIGIR